MSSLKDPNSTPDFPWEAVRDFITAAITLKLAQQNLLVGEAMKSPEEDLDRVRSMVTDFTETLEQADARVKSGLAAMKNARRIVVPR